jgi:endonuclease/exonuclease/phosphatase family metal-dependent hydrolase
MTGDHRLLAYNVRYALHSPGNRAWERRRDAVADTVSHHDPDIVAFQEVWKGQFADLRERLPQFDWVAPTAGEQHTVIAYDPDRYTLLEADSLWLSEPDTEPGVPGWDSTYQKRFTYARLRAGETTCWLFDVHLPYTGETAPRESLKMVRHTVTDVSGTDPVVLAGDLNAEPGSDVYELGSQSRDSLQELTYASDCTETVAGPDATFTGYPDNDDQPCNIDHCLVTPDVTIDRVETVVPETETDEFRPSDHRPILVDLRF